MGPYTLTATDAGLTSELASSKATARAFFTDASGHKINVNLNGPGRAVDFLSPTDGAI